MSTLHKYVVVVDKGVIHGKGLMAIGFIKKGEVVSPFLPGQPTYSVDEVLSMPPEEYKVLRHFAYQSREHIITHEQTKERYMNHSCDPNTTWLDDDTLIASRDILPGEEVTYDYATSEVAFPLTIECHCGSPSCRKIVTNLDYRDSVWQAKYGNMLPQHTLKAIAQWNASIVIENRPEPIQPTCIA